MLKILVPFLQCASLTLAQSIEYLEKNPCPHVAIGTQTVRLDVAEDTVPVNTIHAPARDIVLGAAHFVLGNVDR